jgi:hypothetical protein
MSKKTRDYHRLSHLKSSRYDRNNYRYLLDKSLQSNDIYDRDFYYISSSSTDNYSYRLTNERWKDHTYLSSEIDEEFIILSDLSDQFKLLTLESSTHLIKEVGDDEYLKVVLFFFIIHNIYPELSDDFQNEYSELKDEIIHEIKVFQDKKKLVQTRVSKITTSFQDFLCIYLNNTPSYIKKYVKRYAFIWR